MKKILSLLLVFTLMTSTIAMADVKTYEMSNTHAMHQIIDKSLYDVKEISFTSLEDLKTQNRAMSMDENAYIKKMNTENIEKIQLFIKDMNLSKVGETNLEKVLLNELDGLKMESGYIDKYQFYSPKFTSVNSRSASYYGTYNNREFRDYFSVYNDSYEKDSYNESKHERWAKGLVDLGLVFAPKSINLSYLVLSAATRSDIKTYGSDHIRYDGSDEVTRHYITIEDIYNSVGAGSGEFYVAIVDEARTNTTDIVVDYVAPGHPTTAENICCNKSVECSTWSKSKSSQMRRGYNQFIQDPGSADFNLVGRFSVSFK